METYRPLETVLFTADLIAARVRAIGDQVVADARAAGITEFTVMAVAEGALVFAADLVRAIPMPVRFVSLRVSAYGDGMTPGARAKISGVAPEVAGRHALIVEDILDSGLTLNAVAAELRAQGPASLRTAVLLDKPSGRRHPYVPDYVGFECPDAFVVGYGLDRAGLYRNLPEIGIPLGN